MPHLNGTPHDAIKAANDAHTTNDIKLTSTALVTPPPDEMECPWRWPIDQDSQRAMTTLLRMLQYKRPHQSDSEIKFIRRFLLPLGMKRDGFGNYWKLIYPARPKKGQTPAPHIMWSAHTDTVHFVPGMQRVAVTKGKFAKLAVGEISNCLGADDAAGCWMLREMILKKIPGLYVFHRLEERGGEGAEYFVKNNKVLLEDIEAAIAFDRRGYDSIITHQRSRRMCSAEFARSLSEAIGMDHMPDDSGTFTDTAEYGDIVPECTNVSVGYFNAHSATEHLDLLYLANLRIAVLEADWSQLVFVRDPSVREWRSYRSPTYHGGYGDTYSGGYESYAEFWQNAVIDKPTGNSASTSTTAIKASTTPAATDPARLSFRDSVRDTESGAHISTANAGRVLPYQERQTGAAAGATHGAQGHGQSQKTYLDGKAKPASPVRGFLSDPPTYSAYQQGMQELWGDANHPIPDDDPQKTEMVEGIEAEARDMSADDDARERQADALRRLSDEGKSWLRDDLGKYRTVKDVVLAFPDEVADYLELDGTSAEDLLIFIKEAYNI